MSLQSSPAAQGSPPATGASNAELAVAAERIKQNVDAADDQLIKAARDLAAIEKRFKKGEFAPLDFLEWAREQLGLKETRIAELLRVGRSRAPYATLANGRAKNAARQARSRAKHKSGPAHPRVVQEAPASRNADEPPGDVEQLVAWAQSAPVEQVRYVLAFIRTEFV